jgi:hypothetical protein
VAATVFPCTADASTLAAAADNDAGDDPWIIYHDPSPTRHAGGCWWATANLQVCSRCRKPMSRRAAGVLTSPHACTAQGRR